MTTTVLDRTHDQRMNSLRRANVIRTYRAEVKRNLKAGADPIPMLRDLAPELATMKALTFVMALPKVGVNKASRLLIQLQIAQSKTLAGLSDRQRAALISALSTP